jgi:hypothetical protein
MTLVRLTWQPDDSVAETMTADLPAARVGELQALLADPDTDFGEAAMWIPVRLDTEPPGAPFMKRLFRLSRITAVTRADKR